MGEQERTDGGHDSDYHLLAKFHDGLATAFSPDSSGRLTGRRAGQGCVGEDGQMYIYACMRNCTRDL